MPPTAAPLPKQNLQIVEHPDGSASALLTVTFHDGTVQKFETALSPEELEAAEGQFVGAELATVGGAIEVGAFGFLKKAIKGIGKVGKAVLTSKIMKVAATGLAVASPILGPLAPAALAASAGLGIAGKLASAAGAAAKGATNVAKQIAESAHLDAKALTTTAAGASALLAAANSKRLAADKVQPKQAPARRTAPAKPALKLTPKPAAAPAAKPSALASSEADLLERARAGRVRSNQNGAVTDAQLLAAHRAGRIYWVL